MPTADEIRTYCAEILRAEAAHVAGKSDAIIEERQRRVVEVEFAHRLRVRFDDLDTFLNAQGKSSERDIVSDTSRLEIEIKYFANEVPQGGNVPMSDWAWLIGHHPRAPQRDFTRLWWLIMPRVGYGHGSKGPGNRAPNELGRWNFQDCLSFTPTTESARLPFLPITEVVNPVGKKGKPLKPAMRFRQDPVTQSILQAEVDGNAVLVRADLLGDPHSDSAWGMFYATITADVATTLQDYVRLPLTPLTDNRGQPRG